MLRIVGGRFRGRRIKTPPGRDTRPTSDRVREALFSMLGQRVPGARAADLFAGSGALGLEAISRGAASCLFVENRRAALAVLAGNLSDLEALDCCRVLAGDAAQAGDRLVSAGPVDLALADPPYGKGQVERLVRLAASPFLAPGGLMVIEHHKDESPVAIPGLSLTRQKSYGKTFLSFMEKDS